MNIRETCAKSFKSSGSHPRTRSIHMPCRWYRPGISLPCKTYIYSKQGSDLSDVYNSLPGTNIKSADLSSAAERRLITPKTNKKSAVSSTRLDVVGPQGGLGWPVFPGP